MKISIVTDLKGNNQNMSKKVFLGGTCNGSKWRNPVMAKLAECNIGYFNPVVENWTPECQEEERKQRQECTVVAYAITPKMTGVYSIAELIESSIIRPESTVILFKRMDDGQEFTDPQWASIEQVAKTANEYGARVTYAVEDFVNAIKLI